MTDGYINFDEYIRQGEPAQRERAEAWRVAIGLQAVFFPIDNTTLMPLRGEFGGHSPIPRTMSLANSLPPFQGVNGWCAPKGQQTDSKGQRPVAIGEDGERLTNCHLHPPILFLCHKQK